MVACYFNRAAVCTSLYPSSCSIVPTASPRIRAACGQFDVAHGAPGTTFPVVPGLGPVSNKTGAYNPPVNSCTSGIMVICDRVLRLLQMPVLSG
jgi:hypothetical protein